MKLQRGKFKTATIKLKWEEIQILYKLTNLIGGTPEGPRSMFWELNSLIREQFGKDIDPIMLNQFIDEISDRSWSSSKNSIYFQDINWRKKLCYKKVARKRRANRLSTK
jgi:hypothetical protein